MSNGTVNLVAWLYRRCVPDSNGAAAVIGALHPPPYACMMGCGCGEHVSEEVLALMLGCGTGAIVPDGVP